MTSAASGDKTPGTFVITGGIFNSGPTVYVNTETHSVAVGEAVGTWTVHPK